MHYAYIAGLKVIRLKNVIKTAEIEIDPHLFNLQFRLVVICYSLHHEIAILNPNRT